MIAPGENPVPIAPRPRRSPTGPGAVETLAAWTALVVGVGVVGAPLARALCDLGVARILLCDPKYFRTGNVPGQCGFPEVGRAKVEVLAERLAADGAEAHPIAQGIATVDRGWATTPMVVVVAADRLSAQRETHEWAHAEGLPLVRVNIDPITGTAVVSVFRYDRGADGCLLCVWGPREFAAQTRVRSCGDGPASRPRGGGSEGRPTGGSSPLASAAAAWAALVIEYTLGDGPGAIGHGDTVLFHPATGTVSRSRIPANPECPTDHAARPPETSAIADPRATLADLARAAHLDRAPDLRVRGSGEIGLELECHRCGARWRELLWRAGIDRRRPRCPCGGRTTIPLFARVTEATREELQPWWDRPLAELGVVPPASIRFRSGTRERAFRWRPDGESANGDPREHSAAGPEALPGAGGQCARPTETAGPAPAAPAPRRARGEESP